jgi:hypothetical protein
MGRRWMLWLKQAAAPSRTVIPITQERCATISSSRNLGSHRTLRLLLQPLHVADASVPLALDRRMVLPEISGAS